MRANAYVIAEQPDAAPFDPGPRSVHPVHHSDDDRLDHFIERDGIRFAGTHLLVDFFGAQRLDNLELMESALRGAVEAAGATLLHIHLHHFTPNGGVSGVAVLAESHISIHSWPECDYAALDVLTLVADNAWCGGVVLGAEIPGWPDLGPGAPMPDALTLTAPLLAQASMTAEAWVLAAVLLVMIVALVSGRIGADLVLLGGLGVLLLTGVLAPAEAVSGFASHEVRHDHLWVKQGRAVRRASRGDAAESNVKTLFAGKAATD